MDVHIVPGVKARNVAEAHRQDLLHQEEYGCKCMTYWIDEARESIFCLIEAPDKDTVKEMHSKAHGLVPNKVVEVSSSLVQSFLGRIYDPEKAETSPDGLKVFSDSGFRILLITKTTDPLLLQHHFGKDAATAMILEESIVFRKNIAQYEGAEIQHGGNGFIISFASASKAIACALSIQNDLPEKTAAHLELRMSITSGEPIEKSDKLFGDAIERAHHYFILPDNIKLTVASSVKELASKDYFHHHNFNSLSHTDELLLDSLVKTLNTHWQRSEFDVDEFAREMAMSNSQLYRKTMALTGLSPNILLKEYRLEKAMDLMKKDYYTISQITFDCGFTSPSYFTKCFKKKFGILPANYMDLL